MNYLTSSSPSKVCSYWVWANRFNVMGSSTSFSQCIFFSNKLLWNHSSVCLLDPGLLRGQKIKKKKKIKILFWSLVLEYLSEIRSERNLMGTFSRELPWSFLQLQEMQTCSWVFQKAVLNLIHRCRRVFQIDSEHGTSQGAGLSRVTPSHFQSIPNSIGKGLCISLAIAFTEEGGWEVQIMFTRPNVMQIRCNFTNATFSAIWRHRRPGCWINKY